MKIKIENILKEGILLDKYSDGASAEERIEGVPYINFPFEVETKENYKYLSWVLVDHDSNPVVNFSWLHWVIANYELDTTTKVEENLVNSTKKYVGGTNTFASPLAKIKDKKVIYNYGGPTPPDKTHIYTLQVYAHNEKLNLTEGFYLNDLYQELTGKILEQDEIQIPAKCFKE